MRLLHCVRETDEDITAPRQPVGSPRGWALAGLIILVPGVLFIYIGLSAKNDATAESWMLLGLIQCSLGFFTLLLALFWHETLSKYRARKKVPKN